MSVVENVSETVRSVTPLGTDGPDPDAYKCRNCGRDVDLNDDNCQNCGSANLRPIRL